MDEKVIKIINLLLNHLPDSNHDDKSWDWCWEALSGDAQEEVKVVRENAILVLTDFLEGRAKC